MNILKIQRENRGKSSRKTVSKELEKTLPGVSALPNLNNYRTAGWHSWSNNTVKQPFAALYTSLLSYKCSLHDKYYK